MMMDANDAKAIEQTPDAALSEQAEPVPPITFEFKGKTVTLEVPFKKPVWFWILTHSSDSLDPNESDSSLFSSLGQCIALEAERILSVATGLTLKELKDGVETAELQRVLREVPEQLGRELTASGPFTHFRDALEAVNRLALLARGAKGSSGRQPSLQSKPNSAAGRKRRQTK
jgi:hypothetical protein